MLTFQVAKPTGLAALARDLKRAGGTHRARLTAGLRAPTRDIHDQVRQRVLTGSMRAKSDRAGRRPVPAGLGRNNHVRRPLLAGLSWKVSTSSADPRAEVVWSPGKVARRVRPLWKYFVREIRDPLRHPIFGKTRMGDWRGAVTQQTPDAWAPARKLPDAVQKAVAKVCDDTAAMIAGRKR